MKIITLDRLKVERGTVAKLTAPILKMKWKHPHTLMANLKKMLSIAHRLISKRE